MEIETFCPASRQEWRDWLMKNHDLKQSVWLVQYKKSSGIPSLTWSESVDEALCFGWIDSVRKPIDHEKFIQFFSRRKPKGTWSKINKEKIKQLIDANLMTQAGFESIEKAKQNGSWTILDEVEELTIPPDLVAAFKNQPKAEEYFLSLSKSAKKILLHSLVFAKRPETRENRINKIIGLAVQNS
ncbi:MAG: YdeI/OmpD-associated family protein [Bacteroidota bacterium]